MIKVTKSSMTRSDETASYSVDMDKEYTLSEFINEMVSKYSNEFGDIGLSSHFHSIEYHKGKIISEIPTKYKDMKVVSAYANGGWGRMDYQLTLK